MKTVKMVSDLIFNMKRDLKIVHVFVHDEKLYSFFISIGSGPYNDFDDLIDHITVDSEAKDHADEHISNFGGIRALNITIRNVSDGIDSPIK